jgi:DNA invertase Pin-like site-specific DNA recombinase
MTQCVALYARVSSERQVQTRTIESQIAALEPRLQNLWVIGGSGNLPS